MIDIRPVLFVVGILLTTLAGFMFIPALADAVVGNPDWRVFLAAAFFTLFVGVTLVLTNRAGPVRLGVRQTFLLTTMAWVVMAAFAALPFAFADFVHRHYSHMFQLGGRFSLLPKSSDIG